MTAGCTNGRATVIYVGSSSRKRGNWCCHDDDALFMNLQRLQKVIIRKKHSLLRLSTCSFQDIGRRACFIWNYLFDFIQFDFTVCPIFLSTATPSLNVLSDIFISDKCRLCPASVRRRPLTISCTLSTP